MLVFAYSIEVAPPGFVSQKKPDVNHVFANSDNFVRAALANFRSYIPCTVYDIICFFFRDII